MTEAYIILFLAACLVAAGYAVGQKAVAARERARNELEMEKVRSDIAQVKEKILGEAAAGRDIIAREQKTLAYRETRFKEEMLGREREMSGKQARLERESRELAARERRLAEKEKTLNEKEKQLSGDVQLTEDFKKALELMENTDRHLFITGKAGTGKSTLLDYFRLRTKKSVVVLAYMGIAAMHIRGQTINSFFRFPPGLLTENDIVFNPALRDVLLKTEMVIIDEISMVRVDLMDAIDKSMRKNLKTYLPFGGRQMVFFGDLYQLPPIIGKGEDGLVVENKEIKGDNPVIRKIHDEHQAKYFFNAPVFENGEAPIQLVEVKTVFRQKDGDFIAYLNKVRTNDLTADQLAELNRRLRGNYSDELNRRALRICPHTKQAGLINEERLAEIVAKPFTYDADIVVYKDKVAGETDLTIHTKLQSNRL